MRLEDLGPVNELAMERGRLMKKHDAAGSAAAREYLQGLIDAIDDKLRALGVEPPQEEGEGK